MLKKVHELGMLCGVKVTLVFTDLKGNIISFSNNKEMSIVLADELIENTIKSGRNFTEYTSNDVRFTLNSKIKKLTF